LCHAPAPPAPYTLSLHDALPILAAVLETAPVLLCPTVAGRAPVSERQGTVDGVETPLWVRFTYPFNLSRNPAGTVCVGLDVDGLDRKSTRLNSSHVKISYAVFCL